MERRCEQFLQGSSCFTTEQGWPKDAIETQDDPPVLATASPDVSPLLIAEDELLPKQSLLPTQS